MHSDPPLLPSAPFRTPSSSPSSSSCRAPLVPRPTPQYILVCFLFSFILTYILDPVVYFFTNPCKGVKKCGRSAQSVWGRVRNRGRGRGSTGGGSGGGYDQLARDQAAHRRRVEKRRARDSESSLPGGEGGGGAGGGRGAGAGGGGNTEGALRHMCRCCPPRRMDMCMDTLRGARMVPRWIAVILTLAVAMGTVAVLGTIVANSFGQLEKKFPMYEREFNKLYVYIYESYCVVFMYTVYRTRRDQETYYDRYSLWCSRVRSAALTKDPT